MKKILLVYGSFIILLITITFSYFYLKNTSTKIIYSLENITPFIEKQDFSTAVYLFEEFKKNYEHKINNFSIITHHLEIREALTTIEELHCNLHLRDKNMSLIKITTLKYQIHNIYKNQIPKIINIF